MGVHKGQAEELMSELERDAKEAFMESVSLHLLTRLSDGAERVCVSRKIIGKTAIKQLAQLLKTGWILSEDYDKNIDTIAEWKRLKTYISDWKETIELQTDLVVMTQEDITLIESGDFDEAMPMLPTYKENLEKWQKSLITKKQQLKEAKIEFKSLKASIKLLSDKFELYISQLEVAE